MYARLLICSQTATHALNNPQECLRSPGWTDIKEPPRRCRRVLDGLCRYLGGVLEKADRGQQPGQR